MGSKQTSEPKKILGILLNLELYYFDPMHILIFLPRILENITRGGGFLIFTPICILWLYLSYFSFWIFEFSWENSLVWCCLTIVAKKWCSICVRYGFRWTSHVTFSSHCISKFACTDKFVLTTFSINGGVKDLGWCQSMELLFCCLYLSARLSHIFKRNNV